MKNSAPIDSLILSRKPDLTDIESLIKHIYDSGIKQSVLVTTDGLVIDGVRRIAALTALGISTVPVFVATTLEEACTVIARTRNHGVAALPQSARRQWHMVTELHSLVLERATRLRKRRVGLPKSAPLERSTKSRELIADAMGLANEGTLNVLVQVYQALNEINPVDPQGEALVQVRTLLDKGEITIYEARGRVQRLLSAGQSGDIISIAEQRNVLATALAQLAGTVKGLDRLGELHPEFSAEEVAMYLTAYADARRGLQRLITTLKKRVP